MTNTVVGSQVIVKKDKLVQRVGQMAFDFDEGRLIHGTEVVMTAGSIKMKTDYEPIEVIQKD